MTVKNNLTKVLYFKRVLFVGVISILSIFNSCKKETSPATVEVNHTGTTDTTKVVVPPGGGTSVTSTNTLKFMFGVNAFEWNFLNQSTIIESNIALIKSFSCVRHYMDWDKLEHTQGSYTFNPTMMGGWNYDAMYARAKQEGILMLADLKTIPPWLISTWPTADQDNEDVPLVYGLSYSDPASYIQHGKVAFQFAARYGYNTNIDKSLVVVGANTGNKVAVSLGLVKYIECNNEEDRWWKGIKAQQSPEEYAADMSAFYDGNMGKFGKNVGVKTADPSMIVVMGGLSTPDPAYVTRMINWCKTNRGYKPDGTVNLCFDVINYHLYNNAKNAGIAPELSSSASIADSFISLAKSMDSHPEVWVTETGYDINAGSPQRAIAIGNKTALVTQADWVLRTSFLYARHGISKLFFYELFDDTPNNPGTYATAGLVDGTKRRPAADYILQTTKLMGDYTFVKTINADPLVDQYTNGTKTMYVLMIPDQKGRTAVIH